MIAVSKFWLPDLGKSLGKKNLKRDINIGMNSAVPSLQNDPDEKRLRMKAFLILLTVLEGFFSVCTLIRIPSETEHAVLFGLSKSRLLLTAVALVGIVFFLAFFFIYVFKSLKPVRLRIEAFLRRPTAAFCVLAVCWAMLLICCWLFVFRFSPANAYDSTVGTIVARTWGLLVWGILIALQTAAFLVLSSDFKVLRESLRSPLRMAIFFTIFMLTYYGFAAWYDRVDWSVRMNGLGWLMLAPCGVALIWAAAYPFYAGKRWAAALNTGLLCLLIGTFTFMGYRMTSYWMGRWNTPAKAYWDLLAEAFLNGQLHLSAPPSTHDLTLYNGRWFVPNPPLPAILLMPFVKWLGVEGVNMTVVSAVFGALNAVAVFLVLQRAAARSMIPCSRSAILWLTAVFAFGTNHFWLATTGQMWFISQLVTVLFVAFATLSAIEDWPGWVTGLLLGLAILARPNVFPIAILLAGIFLWRQAEFPGIPWKRFILWAITAAIPAIVCTVVLFGYNYLRFDDWFDFGYVTINGADWILEAVRQYGMFHPHFFRINLDVMILRLPRLDFSGQRFFFQPGIAGYSIFVMTPPLIYLVRGFRKNWWVIGAWLSVLLTCGLLLCYHNTGAEQVGYRYLLDAMLPILLLLGVGIGRRPNWLFKTLAAVGFIVNALSIYWWYIGRA